MIDLEFLQSLIRAMDESGLDSIEIERGGTRVRLSKTPTGTAVTPAAPAAPHAGTPPAHPGGAPPVPSGGGAAREGEAAGGGQGAAAPAAEDTSHLADIESPMVGTFYRAPAPDAPPYVEVGDRVKKGDTLCIIEAMKLMNELEAEVNGTIAEICVENAEPVEYGQVLFRVEPS